MIESIAATEPPVEVKPAAAVPDASSSDETTPDTEENKKVEVATEGGDEPATP